MSIPYVKRMRKNPMEPMSIPKYYITAKAYSHVKRETLVDDMVRNTSLTKQEAETALHYLFEAIPRYLALGNTVQLGPLGYFKYTISSEGITDPNKISASMIKTIRLKFIPGRELREQVRRFSLTNWNMH